MITFSCIIPAKDPNDPLLKDLIASINAQDFPQDQIEIIVVTEGDSEQAKAIGIKRAQGEICAMFCADNHISDSLLFSTVYKILTLNGELSAIYPCKYFHYRKDWSLNRYFALIGGNDPVCYYLGKNDRWPHVDSLRIKSKYQPSYGCNGFFYRTKDIRETDLDNYYPMDNAMEVKGKIASLGTDSIWHRTVTDNNLLKFLARRYRYARDLYSNRSNRRWKMIDTKEVYLRLLLFILFTLTLVQPILVSLKSYLKIRDVAVFWHPVVCLGFLAMYGILTIETFLKRLSSFLHRDGTPFRSVLNPFAPNPSKTSR